MATRTSLTHPLRIAELPVPDGGGRIGVTFCPGKCDLRAHDGPWTRDLPLDLGVIRGWGANALVSLVEEHELDELHVPDLGDMAESAGLEWHHLPIPDMGVPGWHFERQWTYAGTRLRRLLRRGGRVVVHCRAGLGRAGTIAARLLVELGMPVAEAVSQVRKARPGAIQTPDQERHVQVARRVSDHQDEIVSRRLACLLGGALGDAFGYPVAFDRLEAIRERHGDLGLREPEYRHGRLVVSDETQLTLFTLEGLTRAMQTPRQSEHDILAQIRLSYLDWLECQGLGNGAANHPSRLFKHAVLHTQRTPGKLCIQALREGGGGSPERPINDSRDSSGVMRTGPVALMPEMTMERAFRVAARSAALTHGHPGCYLPAGILAGTLHGLLDNKPLQTALLQAADQARTLSGHEETLAQLRAAVDTTLLPHTDRLPEALGAGRDSGAALCIGYYAASRAGDFREALALAANQDGDSDAAASVAGQLFATREGLEAVPHAWVRRLDVLEALCDLVDWALPLWRRGAILPGRKPAD
ncbi:MAG: ADP-ribosylglycohydrolase family protein [Pseudomonadota bacterium]